LTFLEGDTAGLRAMVHDVAVGLLAPLLRASVLGGVHQEYGPDGGPSHDVDQVIDGGLGVLDDVEHRQQEFTALCQDLGEAIGSECRDAVPKRNGVVALNRRRWLLRERRTTTR
jgi:hypothetical protein